jgi:competence protein ComEC
VIPFSELDFVLNEYDKQIMLEIFVLDVGQGDATLIRSPDGKTMLVDGGRGDSVMYLLDRYLNHYDLWIDVVISTHADADHIEGLLAVIDKYEIGELLWTKSSKNSALNSWYKYKVKDLGINSYIVDSFDDFRLGCCIEVDLIWPLDTQSVYHADSNESSVAIVIEYADFQMYLAGDLGYENEEKAIQLYDNPESIDVMKVSHHGSLSSTSEALVRRIDPLVGVISAGRDNSYNHPNPAVLEILGSNSVNVFRTDEHGTVSISSDGASMFIRSENLLEEFGFRL